VKAHPPKIYFIGIAKGQGFDWLTPIIGGHNPQHHSMALK